MVLGINQMNSNMFASPAQVVSGSELTKVAQEIFSTKASAPTAKELASFEKAVSNVDVRLFGADASANLNTIKLAATNKANFEVALSAKASAAINNLNAQAAQSVFGNIAQRMDGKIHINNEQTDFSAIKASLSTVGSPEVFSSESLNKDRRGSGGFFAAGNPEMEEQQEEGLNLIA